MVAGRLANMRQGTRADDGVWPTGSHRRRWPIWPILNRLHQVKTLRLQPTFGLFWVYFICSQRSISMDGSPFASRFRFDRRWSVANIYPASPDRVGAPKWGIRSRTPLQLVGLEGLDKNQVRCAPVRPVRLISPSSRKLWGRPSEDGAVRLATAEHGPDDPCVLVGDRHRGTVESAPLPKLVDPLIGRISLFGCRSHNRAGTVNEQAA